MGNCEFIVRAATALDDEPGAALLCDSITRLCVADHRNDAFTLERWLSNKTPEQFARWRQDRSNYVIVADRDGVLGGVGLLHGGGDLRLCYVRVGLQRAGIGRALVEELEARARRWDLPEVFLTSSVAARPFYEHLGYKPTAPPFLAFGVLRSYPYAKRLSDAAL